MDLAALVFDDPRLRELGQQVLLQNAGVIGERDAADTALRCGDQESPERGRDRDVRDAHALAAARVCRGRHTELRVGTLIDAARGAISSFVECGAHLFPPFQLAFESIDPARFGIRPGRDAEHAFECAREPARVTARWPAGRDRARRLAHQHDGGIASRRIGGTAPLACAVAFALGGLGDGIERDLGTARPPAGARRAAVDARRPDRVDERAVAATISGQHGLPTLGGTHGRQRNRGAHAHSIRFLRSNPDVRARPWTGRRSRALCRQPSADTRRTDRDGGSCRSA